MNLTLVSRTGRFNLLLSTLMRARVSLHKPEPSFFFLVFVTIMISAMRVIGYRKSSGPLRKMACSQLLKLINVVAVPFHSSSIP